MPRYIDADKLFTWLVSSWRNKYPIGDGSQFDIVHIYEIKEEIDNAETVDAIPTEWIVGRLHSLYKSEMFGSSQDKYTEALERLLQEWWKWRKENA